VNLSARQFREPSLPTMVADALANSGLNPALLELEITESMLMEDSSEFSRRLAMLKDLGASLIIDDFGTGYSSLAYLKRLPVDGVKIDRTFIEGIPAMHASSEIASAIIAMANKLHLRVVAEGVENEAQLRFLRENGCSVYQGFLAGRPQPLQELLRTRAAAGEG
jgi:EAL domain-containing protein (putative c-di-GMP-specific phosphodiesterase class I)